MASEERKKNTAELGISLFIKGKELSKDPAVLLTAYISCACMICEELKLSTEEVQRIFKVVVASYQKLN